MGAIVQGMVVTSPSSESGSQRSTAKPFAALTAMRFIPAVQRPRLGIVFLPGVLALAAAAACSETFPVELEPETLPPKFEARRRLSGIGR